MDEGIRAEIRITNPPNCPIAALSGRTNTDSYSISRSVNPHAPTEITEEFLLDGTANSTSLASTDADIEDVFSYGDKHAYRFTRPVDWACPCECIEQFDCPVIDVHAHEGKLDLAFHAKGIDQLQQVVTSLKDQNAAVEVKRLLRTQGDAEDHNIVFVDTQELTDRQREILETAHEMGYFDHPKGANAGEIADQLGITTATFTEHLSAAQRKMLSAILDA